MNPLVPLLAPIVMLLPVSMPAEPIPPGVVGQDPTVSASAQQVSIQQSVIIRISPRPSPVQPVFFGTDMGAGREPRFIERKFGKCLPIDSIWGVQPVSSNRLLLILRNQRMITAQLDKGCQAQQYYSGFVVKRSVDGQICTSRDALLSRSGTSCQVSGFKQIIPIGP